MKLHLRLVLTLTVLVLAMLACEAVMGGDPMPEPTITPIPTNTPPPVPTSTPQPTATPTTLTPQGVTSGRNFYAVTVTEQGCSLSLSAEEQYREIAYEGNSLSIKNNNSEGWETYEQVAPYRYRRINDADRPIVVEISLNGYVLEVYNVGDDSEAVAPCGYFTFTLAGE